MTGRFRHFLIDLELLELHLHGRLFTLHSERMNKIFVSPDWELLFPSSYLQGEKRRNNARVDEMLVRIHMGR